MKLQDVKDYLNANRDDASGNGACGDDEVVVPLVFRPQDLGLIVAREPLASLVRDPGFIDPSIGVVVEADKALGAQGLAFGDALGRREGSPALRTVPENMQQFQVFGSREPYSIYFIHEPILSPRGVANENQEPCI